MTYNEKKLMKNGIVIPLIMSVLFAVLFLVSIYTLGQQYRSESPANNAAQAAEISEINEFDGETEADGSIKKSALSDISSNCVIGKIYIGEETFDIINNASNSAALGRFNIKENSALIGETGSCFMEVYKDNSSRLRLLTASDTITLETYFGSYEYTVEKTFTADSKSELTQAGEGLSSALVLYTDGSVGAGIGSNYFVCVCEMTTGAKVTA